jgi:hypothetical protein
LRRRQGQSFECWRLGDDAAAMPYICSPYIGPRIGRGRSGNDVRARPPRGRPFSPRAATDPAGYPGRPRPRPAHPSAVVRAGHGHQSQPDQGLARVVARNSRPRSPVVADGHGPGTRQHGGHESRKLLSRGHAARVSEPRGRRGGFPRRVPIGPRSLPPTAGGSADARRPSRPTFINAVVTESTRDVPASAGTRKWRVHMQRPATGRCDDATEPALTLAPRAEPPLRRSAGPPLVGERLAYVPIGRPARASGGGRSPLRCPGPPRRPQPLPIGRSATTQPPPEKRQRSRGIWPSGVSP